MSRLTEEQEAMQASIKKTALIWGCIGGVIVALIALWAFGSQGSAVRFGGAAVLGAGAGFGLFKWSFNNGSKAAQCAKCGAAFSITRTDRSEKVLGSAPKESREQAEDRSTKVTTWTEESYEVTETFTCSKCSDVTTKKHTSTRKKDEKSVVEAAAPLGVAGAMAAGSAAAAADIDADAPKSMKGATGAGGTSGLKAGADKGAPTAAPTAAPASAAVADIPESGAKTVAGSSGTGGKSTLKSGASKGAGTADTAPADEDEKQTRAKPTKAKAKKPAQNADDPFADQDAPAAPPSNTKKKGS